MQSQKISVKKPTTHQSWIKLHGFYTGNKPATWNMTSLFRIGTNQNLAHILIHSYNIKTAALQEIRWLGVDHCKGVLENI